MAYIEMEKAIAEIDKGDLLVGNNAEWAKEIIRRTPTADVVPKSEVERLETEVRLLTENSISTKYPCCVSTSKGLILTKSLEEYDKLLADIASEVASEIFAEIERLITKECLVFKDENGIRGYVDASVHYAIAELKKKYIGDKR